MFPAHNMLVQCTDINKRIADNICNALVKENSIFTIYYRNSCSGGIIKHAFP